MIYLWKYASHRFEQKVKTSKNGSTGVFRVLQVCACRFFLHLAGWKKNWVFKKAEEGLRKAQSLLACCSSEGTFR